MKKLILSFLFIFSISLNAQKKGVFKISGSIDTYFASNLTTSELGTIGVLSDVAANGFGLGMVNGVASYKKGKTGMVADLAFGPRANQANAYRGSINQLYIYYQATEKLKFTLGQFNTFFGYEVISPSQNFNYTVSYLFNAGPFSHTGLRADYQASKDLSFMLAFTNPHGIMAGSNTTDSFQFGFQTGYKEQFFNLAYGADGFGFNDVLYLDYTGGFHFGKELFFGIDAEYSNSEKANRGYYGFALYLQNTFTETFSLGIRPEFYTTTSSNGNINQQAYTLSANVNLSDDLRLIPELRYDTSKDITFIGGKENITGLTIAAIYSF